MKPLLLLFLALTVASPAFARKWTSRDGKTTIEAEFISATPDSVTILRSDNRKFTIPLTKLSEGDVNYLKAIGKIPEPPPAARPLNAKLVEVPEGFPEDAAELLNQREAKLLFEDEFERTDSNSSDDLGRDWETNSEKSAGGAKQTDIENGTLVITLSDKAEEPASARHALSEPFKDGVVSLKVKLDEEEEVVLAYDDREDPSAAEGRINAVTIAPDKLAIDDGKATEETPAREKRIQLKPGAWTDVVTVHDGDTLTVYLNGYRLLSQKSPGIAHETKRDFVIAVPKKATVDELKIWKLAPPAAE